MRSQKTPSNYPRYNSMPRKFHDVSGPSTVTQWLETTTNVGRSLPSGHLRRRQNKYFALSSTLFGDDNAREQIKGQREQGYQNSFQKQLQTKQLEEQRLQYEDQRIYDAMSLARRQPEHNFDDLGGPSKHNHLPQQHQQPQQPHQPQQPQPQITQPLRAPGIRPQWYQAPQDYRNWAPPNQGVRQGFRQPFQPASPHYRLNNPQNLRQRPSTTYEPSFMNQNRQGRPNQPNDNINRLKFPHNIGNTNFREPTAQEIEQNRINFLNYQAEEKRIRDQEALEREAYEDRLFEENAIRQREALRLEFEQEHLQLAAKDKSHQRRQDLLHHRTEEIRKQIDDEKQEKLLKLYPSLRANRHQREAPDIQVRAPPEEEATVSEAGASISTEEFDYPRISIEERLKRDREKLEMHRRELDSMRYDHSSSATMAYSQDKEGKRMRMPSRKTDDYGLNLNAASKVGVEKVNASNSFVDSDERRRKIRNLRDKRFKKQEVGKFGGSSPLPPIGSRQSSASSERRSSTVSMASYTNESERSSSPPRSSHYSKKEEFDWRVEIESPTLDDGDSEVDNKNFKEKNRDVLGQLSALKTRLKSQSDIEDDEDEEDDEEDELDEEYEGEKEEEKKKGSRRGSQDRKSSDGSHTSTKSSTRKQSRDNNVYPEEEFKRKIDLSTGKKVNLEATNKTLLRSFLKKSK